MQFNGVIDSTLTAAVVTNDTKQIHYVYMYVCFCSFQQMVRHLVYTAVQQGPCHPPPRGRL